MAPTPISVDWTTSDPLEADVDQGVKVSCAWAESNPNMTEAVDVLQYGFQIHVYFFATCYAILLSYAIYSIVATTMGHQKRKRLGISLHMMIAVSSLTRALTLFIDPYGFAMILPCPVNVIIWSLGWPGIVSSYSIFFLAALESTQLTIGPPRFQRLSTLAVIIAVSIAYVLFADLLVSYLPSAIISMLVCELMFVVWGLALSLGFVYVWCRMRRNLSASCPRNSTERRRSSVHGSVKASEEETRRLKRLITIFLISSVDCLVLTGTHIVPVIGFFEPRIVDFVSKPWQWFAFQTGQRILEIIMCVLIIVAMCKSTTGNDDGSDSKVDKTPTKANAGQNNAPDSQPTLSRLDHGHRYTVG